MHRTGSRLGTAEREKRPPADSIVVRRADRSTAATSGEHDASKLETMLLKIAGEDLLRSVEAIQTAHDYFDLGVRTSSEQRWLQCSRKAVDRFKEQLAQIQTVLQVRAHATRPQLRPVSVHELLRQARREHEHAALSKGICMRVVPIGDSIKSDNLLLGAALRNLVSNAIRYTRPGGRILIGCRGFETSIRIDVYDTGVGIPGEQIPKIFDAFTRLDPGRCEGSGIGLFIVRQAIMILGHRIEVASAPGRGSRFSILVPRAGR